MRDDLVENPVEWGRQLILTEDHDPLYSSLVRWEVNGARRRRFMLAYWCCYSVGASWWISAQTGTRFWEWLAVAAENVRGPRDHKICDVERWPRAHERRHWRGQKCIDSVKWLSTRFRHPEEAVLSLEGSRTAGAVGAAMKDWPQFGPWIAFKAADMLERILGVPVTFSNDLTSMYEDPRKGAEMMAPYLGVDTPQEVTDRLLAEYEYIRAPGVGDRPDHISARLCNVQEVETVLCKWKSARGGHYWLGSDTKSHRDELSVWGAIDLLDAYPKPRT